MSLIMVVGLPLVLLGIVAWIVLEHYVQRCNLMALGGIAIVFFSLPLSKFLAFSDTNYASPEVIESWQFSFRFLGIALFIWGMCHGIGQKIDSLKSKP